MEIENGTFHADHNIHHTHEGSIGNLCNDKIAEIMDKTLAEFGFERVDEAERSLLAAGV